MFRRFRKIAISVYLHCWWSINQAISTIIVPSHFVFVFCAGVRNLRCRTSYNIPSDLWLAWVMYIRLFGRGTQQTDCGWWDNYKVALTVLIFWSAVRWTPTCQKYSQIPLLSGQAKWSVVHHDFWRKTKNVHATDKAHSCYFPVMRMPTPWKFSSFNNTGKGFTTIVKPNWLVPWNRAVSCSCELRQEILIH